MSAAMNAAAFICMQMQGHRQGSHMLVCCLFFETSAGCTGRAAASDSDGHATPQGTMAEISTMSVRKAAAAMLEAGEVSLGDVPGSAGLRPTSGCAALPSKNQRLPTIQCQHSTSKGCPTPACLPLLKVVVLFAEDLEGDGLVAEGVLLDVVHGLDQSCAGRVIVMKQVPCQQSEAVQ